MRTASIIVAIIVVVGLGYVMLTNKSSAPTNPSTDSGQATTQNPATAQGISAANPSAPTTPAPKVMMTDTKVGTGAEATAGSIITVNYVGTLEGGKKFDASADHKGALRFTLGAGFVIPGWDQGVVGMKVGGMRHLVIPPSLGYGANGAGPIPANATLTFDVELLKVDAAGKAPVQPSFVPLAK